ncbi:MAG: prephenate dehydrogenase, partial [Solirubrobacteraceae bacterium]|nr:prephenate dehydrogenase [Solirubrobacteraceae bacterium]
MKIAVVGTGLIGASIGLAARERLGAQVAGVDPDPAPALAVGAVDEAVPLAAALDGAEAAFVAVPMQVLADTVAAVVAAAPEDCLVTDTGSVKRPVVEAVSDERFVGGHPLAGAERGGAAAARAELFEGATWYLTPTSATSGIHLERLHRLLAGLGARPSVIEADAHDRVMATVSHLPHVLANVLVEQASGALGGEALPATGPSFRDATRVAGANSAIWTDIYLSNADALGVRLDDAIARLNAFRDDLRAGDAGAITAWNDAAATDRRRLLEAGLAGGPTHELRVSVPNRPGVVAELALALGRAGV